DRFADSVADRQRLQERHDHVPPRLHTVDTQCLSEVAAAFLNAEDVPGRIEQAADAGRAVDQKARELATSALDLALKQVVDDTRNERDVVEAVRDHRLDLVREEEVVALRDRPQDISIHASRLKS